MIEIGSSITLLSVKKESEGDGRFRWQSIKTFIIFACTFSSAAVNFDIFSKVCGNVSLIDFIVCEATVGIAYMCMDSFINQYTKRFDCHKYMNPLLRGISYGRFLQTSLFVIIHSTYLADSLRFLLLSFREVPPWSTCQEVNSSDCIGAKDILVRCNRNMSTDFLKTSSFTNYMDTFASLDRSALTTRFFILGLVWIIVFFFASASEETIVKLLFLPGFYALVIVLRCAMIVDEMSIREQNIWNVKKYEGLVDLGIKTACNSNETATQIFKLGFMCRSLSTIVTISFILVSTEDVATEAFSQIVDISSPGEFMVAMRHVNYAYGIGFLGLYDFGSLSSYTMVDTASVIFVTTLTCLAFTRSWIVRILYLTMSKCINIEKQCNAHLLFYAILPLTTEFLHAHKLYVFYFYGNMMIATLVYMTSLIAILSKFLSYEFRSVKQIYIVGMLCCVGIAASIPTLIIHTYTDRARSFTAGMDITLTYLGGAYVAIVMWVYGLKKFCTDIQFWLGFRPTRFWTISWALLPVALFAGTVASIVKVMKLDTDFAKWSAISWAGFTFFVVTAMNVKSMVGFLMANNLVNLFKSNKNYGPPELEDRKRRLYYSEYTRQRKCKHNCMLIDDWFECKHQDLKLLTEEQELTSSSSEESLMNLYDGKTSTRLRSVARVPSVFSQPNLAS